VTTFALVGFAAALALAAPRLLGRAAWAYRAPGLGVLAWHAAAVAVVLAIGLADLATLGHPEPAAGWWGTLWQVCLNALAGAHGVGGRVAALAGSVLLAALVFRLATGGWQVVGGGGRRRRDHRAMLRLAGVRHADREFTVVPHPEPAAYVVPGRRPEVVVTTAALGRLSDVELAAMLAHERAHAAGRHHWLLVAARLLRRAFPWVPLFRHAVRELTRLVEMRADDVAARGHSRLALARALAAMAQRETVPEALHGTGGDALERLRRLLDPPAPLPVPARVLVAAFSGMLPLAPFLILASARLVPPLS
jgi:Zn-dependent protease with chaperone function